jgi:Dna[CI] antecedent, DciA
MAYLIAKSRGKHARAVSQVLQQLANEASPSLGESGLGRLIPMAALSRQMLQTIQPLLPSALARHVLPGKLDAEGWTLVAPNGAAAAKLQQLRPELEAALAQRGMKVSAIRIRVQGPG